MNRAILYIHGQGGSAAEADWYASRCPGFSVTGVEYDGASPWAAAPDIRAAYEALRGHEITLIANSIGAYFAMHALQDRPLRKALLISPVLDMERLILDMMAQAGVSEARLRAKGEIPTAAGAVLSWEYLAFVRAHSVRWNVPTEILYAGGDALIPRETVTAFLQAHPAALTVLGHGEHWFHTPEQLDFLEKWLRRVL